MRVDHARRGFRRREGPWCSDLSQHVQVYKSTCQFPASTSRERKISDGWAITRCAMRKRVRTARKRTRARALRVAYTASEGRAPRACAPRSAAVIAWRRTMAPSSLRRQPAASPELSTPTRARARSNRDRRPPRPMATPDSASSVRPPRRRTSSARWTRRTRAAGGSCSPCSSTSSRAGSTRPSPARSGWASTRAFNHYALLADAWLHGRQDLAARPAGLRDEQRLRRVQRQDVHQLPARSRPCSCSRFVKLAGSPENFRDGQFVIWLAGIAPAVLLLVLEKLRRTGAVRRAPSSRTWCSRSSSPSGPFIHVRRCGCAGAEGPRGRPGRERPCPARGGGEC